MSQLALTSANVKSDSGAAFGSAIGLGWLTLPWVGIAAIAVYFNSLANKFAFDDYGIIENNEMVTNLKWFEVWTSNYWPHTDSPPDILYRPLTVWSYMANYAMGPTTQWHYHAVNIILHALVSMMVALLAYRILRHRSVALFAGLLFAVHPLHGEVVANVVGRAEILAAFWSLAALLIFVPHENVLISPAKPRGWWHGWLVATCFFAAMLCKETPAPLIVAFVLIDAWRWCNWTAPKTTFASWMGGRALRYYLPVLVMFSVYLAMRINATGLMMDPALVHPIVNPLSRATIPERIFTPFLLLAKYIYLSFWPQTLSADYSFPSILPTANPLNPMVALGIMMVVAGIAVMVHYRKRAPGILLVVVLLACGYALVANVLRIGTIFGERLFYWPSAFFFMLIAFGAVRFAERLRLATSLAPFARKLVKPIFVIGALAVLGVLSLLTYDRNPIFKDNVALALATAEANPNSAKACDWAGAVLISETKEQWTISYGESLMKRALELCPTMGKSQWNLATYYGSTGRTGESLWYLSLAAKHYGGTIQMRRTLRLVDGDLKFRGEGKYMPFIEEKMKENPEDPIVQFAYGIATRAQGKLEASEEHFSKALKMDPYFSEAAAELGLIKGMRGDFEGAVTYTKQYVMNMRYNGVARCDLAGALMQLDPKKYPTAMQEAWMNLTKAAELMPDDSGVRLMQARWLKQTASMKDKKNTAVHAAGDGLGIAGPAARG